MYARAHRITQCIVDRLMPFDEALSFEGFAHDQGLEMIAAPSQIAYFHARAGNSRRDHLLQFVRVHRYHCRLRRHAFSTHRSRVRLLQVRLAPIRSLKTDIGGRGLSWTRRNWTRWLGEGSRTSGPLFPRS